MQCPAGDCLACCRTMFRHADSMLRVKSSWTANADPSDHAHHCNTLQGSEAFVRFESADKAAAGHQKANVGSVLTVGGREATVSVLEGDAEQQFAARQACPS